MTLQRRRALARTIVIVLVIGLIAGPQAGPAGADTLPPGFSVQTVVSGLTFPTNLEFGSDGRMFVAEKRGVIKVFDSPADTTATVFADLTASVNEYWDRGLLGLALPPGFPDDPWVYALYTFDAPLGQTTPMNNDSCTAPGNGCVVSARLVRLQAAGNAWTGTEQVLIHDWCAQFPSHTIGDLKFGPDGALYVSGGDGASFGAPDHGQFGNPVNPCGDPPGGTMAPPGAEGGMLRSQDLRTSADPTGLDGTLLRINPATGAAMPGNPLIASADLNNRRVIAYGMRNPFRFTFRPGTDEIWLGDVGWGGFEELNVINPAAPVENLGWPCYEGANRHAAIDSINLTLCESLYTGAGQTGPRFAWRHSGVVYPGDPCAPGSQSAVSGVEFYPTSGGSYPESYHGGLFFADYSRSCVWFMRAPTPGAAPDPSRVEIFATAAASPVDLEIGPNGDLYYVDIGGGTIRRYRYVASNQPPNANLSAQPTNGPAPLTVGLDASASTDPNPGDQAELDYAWDFTDDGTVDSTAAVTSFAYPAGTHTARVTVTDPQGASDSRTVVVTSGNTAPTAVVSTPSAATTWATGQTISFSGAGTDPDDGSLPASALSWRLWLQHCGTPTTCHAHSVQEWNGVAGGSFVAPDHEYPSYLELELRVTDSGGLWHSVMRRLDPRTVDLTFQTDPPGLTLTAAGATATTPFVRTVIEGSGVSMTAPTPQLAGGGRYAFQSWSDSGARSHLIAAPTAATTFTATFSRQNVTNIALNRPATARSSCATTSGPAKAVNGTTSGGAADRWCSVGPSTWLQVDLGSVRPIAGVVLRHAGAGGEAAALNTRDYSVQVSGNGTSWVTVVAEGGNTASVTSYPVSAYARYVRLRITTPSSNGNTTARIYEMEVLAVT